MIIGAAVVIILNLQVLQSFSLFLSQLRQSDAYIPIINFYWRDLSNQLDPSKYQRLVFGIILILMMIYRPAGIFPAARRKRELRAHPPTRTGIGPRRTDHRRNRTQEPAAGTKEADHA